MKKFISAITPFVFVFTALFAMSTLKHEDELSAKEAEKIKSFFSSLEIQEVSAAELEKGEKALADVEGNIDGNSPEEDVTILQETLKNMGLYKAEVDGKYGDATVASVSQFQERNEMPVTGIADEGTVELLANKLVAQTDVGNAYDIERQ